MYMRRVVIVASDASLLPSGIVLFHCVYNLLEGAGDIFIIFRNMWSQTLGTRFYTVFCVFKVSATLVP